MPVWTVDACPRRMDGNTHQHDVIVMFLSAKELEWNVLFRPVPRALIQRGASCTMTRNLPPPMRAAFVAFAKGDELKEDARSGDEDSPKRRRLACT
jgi:hypothetical protein